MYSHRLRGLGAAMTQAQYNALQSQAAQLQQQIFAMGDCMWRGYQGDQEVVQPDYQCQANRNALQAQLQSVLAQLASATVSAPPAPPAAAPAPAPKPAPITAPAPAQQGNTPIAPTPGAWQSPPSGGGGSWVTETEVQTFTGNAPLLPVIDAVDGTPSQGAGGNGGALLLALALGAAVYLGG